MVLMGFNFRKLPGRDLIGAAVQIRFPDVGDYRMWAQLREQSRDFLAPWEPLGSTTQLTKPAFKRRLKRYRRDIQAQLAYPFFIFRLSDQQLVGGITLNRVYRGASQSAALGYWMGAPYARRGYMRDALGLAISFAFNDLSLHRLEAACLPINHASIKLLENMGFMREGLARQYLHINGFWQDHVMYSLLAGDYANISRDRLKLRV